MPKLLIKHPEKGDLSFTISGSRVSVGRRAENSIQINHGTVSGTHAELVAVNGHYVLRDLDSTNHSFVNGAMVNEIDLRRPCKITFGTVECEYVPDSPKATIPLSADLDTLRKNVGILRAQNDELISKLADQQVQIEILSSAKLLMRANAGSDQSVLREQLIKMTAERSDLLAENDALRSEVMMLRNLLDIPEEAPLHEADNCTDTVPIKLPSPIAASN